jgi:hypothetical protein
MDRAPIIVHSAARTGGEPFARYATALKIILSEAVLTYFSLSKLLAVGLVRM